MKPRVVIIGFGDTGVLVAAHLTVDCEITGISTKPALVSGQELGARLTKPDNWKDNYLVEFDRFEKLDGVKIIHGKASAIDPVNKTVTVNAFKGQSKDLSYDILVIASGTRNGFWRTETMSDMETVERNLTRQSDALRAAQNIAIVGAGPTGVSVASNTKDRFPDKEVHLVFRQEKILTGYAPKTQTFLTQKLIDQDVILHSGHDVILPKADRRLGLAPGTLTFASGQDAVHADLILWAIGDIRPNNNFIPNQMLTPEGFVDVNAYLQSNIYPNIFAIGDIAATDPNRSSARNAGFQVLARNIEHYLLGRPQKMKRFRAPRHRWGSVIGIQKEGMRIFTPKGGNVKIRPWSVKNILFPVFVHRLIYKGIRPRKP